MTKRIVAEPDPDLIGVAGEASARPAAAEAGESVVETRILPEPIPLIHPITPAARHAAWLGRHDRVFGKRRWTGT